MVSEISPKAEILYHLPLRIYIKWYAHGKQ